VQWNFITTRPQALRGVHVHCRRWDYMIVLDGEATIGLKDLRRAGGSFGRGALIEVSGKSPSVVTIPCGVAHGVFAASALRYLYGLTVPYDGSDDEFGCRYDDPALALAWPAVDPILLPRDLGLPDYATMLRQYERALGAASPAPAPP
jgi:dTDP-4-dehydrorhamnose 3,5-epimerase